VVESGSSSALGFALPIRSMDIVAGAGPDWRVVLGGAVVVGGVVEAVGEAGAAAGMGVAVAVVGSVRVVIERSPSSVLRSWERRRPR
jgi:hypothetical protein